MDPNEGLFDETSLDKAMRLQTDSSPVRPAATSIAEIPSTKIAAASLRCARTRRRTSRFVRRCSDLSQFWGWVKYKKPAYADRRTLIWNAFRPFIEYLEVQDRTPGVAPITKTLEAFDPDNVHAAWQKALDRRAADPESAITAARMLVETVCKHILDDAGAPYPADADLPKLWTLAVEQANLAPHQHQEGIFKAILGNRHFLVNNLVAIRNRLAARAAGLRNSRPRTPNWPSISR